MNMNWDWDQQDDQQDDGMGWEAQEDVEKRSLENEDEHNFFTLDAAYHRWLDMWMDGEIDEREADFARIYGGDGMDAVV